MEARMIEVSNLDEISQLWIKVQVKANACHIQEVIQDGNSG